MIMSLTKPLIQITRTFVATAYCHELRLHLLIQDPVDPGLDPARIKFSFLALWPEGHASGRAVRPANAPTYSLDDADGREQWLDDVEARAIFGDDHARLMEAIAEACEEVLEAYPIRGDASQPSP